MRLINIIICFFKGHVFKSDTKWVDFKGEKWYEGHQYCERCGKTLSRTLGK